MRPRLNHCYGRPRKVVADDLMRVQLNTMDEERVVAFESDPCAMSERYAAVEHEGAYYYRYALRALVVSPCPGGGGRGACSMYPRI